MIAQQEFQKKYGSLPKKAPVAQRKISAVDFVFVLMWLEFVLQCTCILGNALVLSQQT